METCSADRGQAAVFLVMAQLVLAPSAFLLSFNSLGLRTRPQGG